MRLKPPGGFPKLAALGVLALLVAAGTQTASAGSSQQSSSTVASAPRSQTLAGVWKLARPVHLLRTVEGRRPPLKPEALTVYRRNIALGLKGDFSYDATRRRCSSPGLPRLMTLSTPLEIIERPEQVMMLFAWNHQYRQAPITTTPAEPAYPTAIGAASAHWEGKALVVTTTGRDDKTLLDDALPSSESLQIVEHIQRRGALLEDRITITDPAIFTRAWQTVLTYRQLSVMPDTEDICLDRMATGRPALNP